MILKYLETHVVDNCNLNCKGCSHFCSLIEKERLVDYNHFLKDIKKLNKLYSNIEIFRLMGGEPLLHPELVKFMSASRKYFPNSIISVVTNGLLLSKQEDKFWETCSNANISIDLSNYPLNINKSEIELKCSEYNIKLNISRAKSKFFKLININGDSDPKKSFRNCRMMFNCPFLHEGHIYPCSFAALYGHFSNYFGGIIKPENNTKGVDIYSSTASEIIEFINRPSPMCKFCLSKRPTFEWSKNSANDINEWIGENDNSLNNSLLLLKYIAFNFRKKLVIRKKPKEV